MCWVQAAGAHATCAQLFTKRVLLATCARSPNLHTARAHARRQIDVLVDGFTEDGELYGRTQWDAPDVDPIVFLSEEDTTAAAAAAAGADGGAPPPLEVGQLRRCRVVGASLFDLVAVPVA